MSINPPLLSYGGLPAPFEGEVFLLRRDGVECAVDNMGQFIAGGKWRARGSLYLSNVRLAFAADVRMGGPVHAFDMPLAYIRNEKFNQPIFGSNNLTGVVYSVQGGPPGSLDAVPHSFTLYFMEGGVGTFLPVFRSSLNAMRAVEMAPVAAPPETAASVPLVATDEARGDVDSAPSAPPAPPPPTPQVSTAYVDPNDPSVLYITQPFEENVPRLRPAWRRGKADAT